MDFVVVSLPAEVAEALGSDLGRAAIPTRGLDDVAVVTITVLGLSADVVGLTLARAHLAEAWRRIVSVVSRRPDAEEVHIRYGKKIEVTVRLDEISRDPDSDDARVVQMIASLLSGGSVEN